ncbi:UDP-2,3-diacylglucosamine diphosphatase [Fulvivirga sedimenti]|uniref:UDP-2,3-diacylglucosamine diphosphatase n=1 Tax=Fulvivirga sedimenti TaxID=2879465 RepID=A0A9X1KZ86_9BACT|nr:UDP-2,3-diacylglucosamine diphosphatase [Fulvivirga sedimenti]MCA6077975.1 UDP-2,3-diacylglucosamine diphosphatase [Fulvivirga sedimenti]
MENNPYSIPDLQGKKLYFASDFHLGVPNHAESRKREDRIVRWLEDIRHDAHTIFLLGDVFDFWFEYGTAIPKGFIRLQGKLASLTDSGIPVIMFTGNHDMWMFNYFPEELNIPIYRDLLPVEVGNKRLLIGHGDGLGPGDHTYKFLKKVFRNKFCQWLFARIHPNTGIAIANHWSKRSRISNSDKQEDQFKGEKEYLLQYCREMEGKTHFDFYVFGHRHLPLDIEINETSRYFNLGEWVNYNTYGVFDGKDFELKTFMH